MTDVMGYDCAMDDIQEILAKVYSLRNERAEIHKVIGPMQARLMALYEEERPLKELVGQAQVAKMKAGGPIDWKWLLRTMASDAENTQALLRYFDGLVSERFSMHHSGYYPETMEAALSVMVERNDESERKAVEGVKFFASIVEPFTPERSLKEDEPKRVYFGVFENSLSEHGVYRLNLLPDLQDITLCITVYSRESEVAKFKSVENAIRYIREHHWYGNGPEDV